MAKAQFHKNQRVFVKPVGTWSVVENVLPQWTRGLEEPLRIHYDVGLGREFAADELEAESKTAPARSIDERWRIIRGKNKSRGVDESRNHPYPGTFPIVVTGDNDWGGWRVPAAEYDLDARLIEYQARLIEGSPELLHIARMLLDLCERHDGSLPPEALEIAQSARALINRISEETVAARS